jgi:[ribosomal protein S18]-alanine N-acetyltransferase
MILRPFKPSDLQALYQIDLSCFPPGISYSREEIARFIEHRHSFTAVAEDGKETVGFVIVHREPRKVAHIVTIDVVAKMRRQGAGSVLMEAAENWAQKQGMEMIYLETAENNFVAQRFYQKRGYRKVEKLQRYYPDGTAAWVMVKWLGKPASS